MEKLFYPNREMAKKANIKNICEYQDLVQEANEDYQGFWGRLAKEKIDWFEPFEKVLDDSNSPFYKWFIGGKLMFLTNALIDTSQLKKIKPPLFLKENLAIGKISHI